MSDNIIDTKYEQAEGAEEQEVTEPAEETWEDLDDADNGTGAKDEEAAEPQVEQQVEQSAEENAKYAAARRKAEEDYEKKLEAERANIRSEIDSLIKGLGIASPYGEQKEIQSIDDLRAYSEARQAEMMEEEKEELLNAGMSEDRMNEIINNAVANNPVVKKAQQDAQEYERLKALEQRKATEAIMTEELGKIQSLNPRVTDLKELFASDKGKAMSKIIQDSNGTVSISEAYKLTHFDELMANRESATHQQAVNSLNGKSHLTRSTQTGKGGVDVPPEIAKEFRWYFPDANDDEIAAEYQKYLNEEIRSI